MKQFCQCKEKGTRFCGTHWKIFCDSCKCQNGCQLDPQIKLEKFLKDNFSDITNTYQQFKKDKMNFIFEQQTINEKIVKQQKQQIEKLRKTIVDNLELLKEKKNDFIRNYVNVNLDTFKDSIDSSFKNKDWGNTFGGIQELKDKMDEFFIIQEKLKQFENSNCLIETFDNIFLDLDLKFQKQFQYVLSFKLKTLQDFITVSNKVSDMYFQAEINTQKKIKKKVKQSIILANSIKLETSQIKKTIMINDDSIEESIGEKSKIESFDSDDLEIESMDEKDTKKKINKKKTLLISNNIFKSSLNPQLLDNPKTQIIEDDFDDQSLDMSFEAQDIELEDDIESLEQDFEMDFLNTKTKFSQLLDQVLYDINCVNFFDKNERNKLNEYFEQFRISITQLTVDIKNNFSKM